LLRVSLLLSQSLPLIITAFLSQLSYLQVGSLLLFNDPTCNEIILISRWEILPVKPLKNGVLQPQDLAQRPGLERTAPGRVRRLGIGNFRDMIQAGQIQPAELGRQK
jgi:hypothetical protein